MLFKRCVEHEAKNGEIGPNLIRFDDFRTEMGCLQREEQSKMLQTRIWVMTTESSVRLASILRLQFLLSM